ncbi:MAG: hypothetical protein M0Z66_03630 [Thermaerobacter sp.]|nr:hypothetical protein [Thermaerobacter sp.]
MSARAVAALRRHAERVVGLPIVQRIQPSAAHRRELSLARTTSYGVGLGLLLYLLIAGTFLGRSIFDPSGSFPGFPGDAEQYMWYLGLFWHAVLSGQNPFVTHLMNYPRGMNLMWNTSILAEALLFGPLVTVMSSTVAYNVWFLVNFLASGFLGQQLLGRLGVRQSLAIAGGGLVAMLPYVTTQALSHISLITTAPVLAGALILTIVATGQARRPVLLGMLLGFTAAVQFYTLIEVLVSAVLVLEAGLVTSYFVDRPTLRRVLRKVPASFAIAATATLLVLAAPGLYEMMLGPFRVFNAVQPPNTYVTDLLNFILPTHAFLLQIPYVDPANWFTGNFAEDNGYLGIPAILLIFWAGKRLWPRTVARILLWSAGIVAVFSMGSWMHVAGFAIPLPLPWLLLDHVPFIKDLLPSRLMFYADLALVVLVLLALEDWLRQAPIRPRRPLWWFALVCLTWLPAIPFQNSLLPAATQAFAPDTAVTHALQGKPTYVLTTAFPEIMQSLQKGGYAFPVANVYGHNDNTAQRQEDILGVQALLNPSLSPQVYQAVLSSDLSPLHVRRLVFIPRPTRGLTTLPQSALMTLNGAFGPPIAASSTGVLVWRIPPSDATR